MYSKCASFVLYQFVILSPAQRAPAKDLVRNNVNWTRSHEILHSVQDDELALAFKNQSSKTASELRKLFALSSVQA